MNPNHPKPQMRSFRHDKKLLERHVDDVEYIIFDIETTGGNPERNAMTEICALRYVNGEVTDQFYSLINPMMPIPPIVRRMTGIDNKMVKNAPPIEEVMPRLVKFIGKGVLVSHNTIGDMRFLKFYSDKVLGKAIDNYYLCTHLLVEKLYPETPVKSLKGLAEYFAFVPKGNLHRADADAYLTLDLFNQLKMKFASAHLFYLADVLRYQGDYETGIRIGWAVDADQFTEIPHGPGLLQLFDRRSKMIASVSMSDLKRESARLQKFDLLPKALLRVVLGTYKIIAIRTLSYFEALIEEANQRASLGLAFDASLWNQRQYMALCVQRAPDQQLSIRMGSPDEGDIAVYGPIHDRKDSGQLMAKVVEILGGKIESKRWLIPAMYQHVLTEFLTGNLSRKLHSLEVSRKGILAQWISSRRTTLEDRISKAKLLQQLKLRHSYQGLERFNGAVLLPDGTQTRIHIVAQGRILQVLTRKFQLSTFAAQTSLLKQLVVKTKVKAKRQALTKKEALRANYIFWWIQNQSKAQEGRFYSHDQCLELLRQREKPARKNNS